MFKTSSSTKLGLAALSLVLASTLGASSATAHHGGGTFDPSKCYMFKGTMRGIAWANPHSWIYVDVEKGNAKELWGFELGTIGGLSRLGFRPADFAKGTPVTVKANINRTAGKRTGTSNQTVLSGNRVVGGAEASGTAVGSAGQACPDYK